MQTDFRHELQVHFFDYSPRLILIRIRQSYRKFVTAQTSDNVRIPQAFCQACADNQKHLVTFGVAEGVICFFKIIQIDIGQRKRAFDAPANPRSFVTVSLKARPFKSTVRPSVVAICCSIFRVFFILARSCDMMIKKPRRTQAFQTGIAL
jgi:hypothetical protein